MLTMVAQTVSYQNSDHAMAKLDTAKLKTAALELNLRNRFEGLQVDENASSREWRELKDEVADASQAHLRRPRRRSQDWVTDEAIALAEQACLARIESVPNYRDL